MSETAGKAVAFLGTCIVAAVIAFNDQAGFAALIVIVSAVYFYGD